MNDVRGTCQRKFGSKPCIIWILIKSICNKLLKIPILKIYWSENYTNTAITWLKRPKCHYLSPSEITSYK